MKVREVMSTRVHTATPDTPYKELLQRMLTDKISGLPIVDDVGLVVGIVTEADLIRKVAFGGGRDPHVILSLLSRALTGQDSVWTVRVEGLKASEIMSQSVVSVGPDDEVDHAARVMLAHHVKRLPVLEEGRLVGLVARRDLMRFFEVADATIAAEVERSLTDLLSAPEGHQVTSSVEAGVVSLSGTVLHSSDVAIVTSLVGATVGVVAVRSAVIAREPEPGLENIDFPLDRL